jgi:hypothetical protein
MRDSRYHVAGSRIVGFVGYGVRVWRAKVVDALGESISSALGIISAPVCWNVRSKHGDSSTVMGI